MGSNTIINTPQARPILDLPPEIILRIIPNLSFPSNIKLRTTCHYFHAIIQPMNHADILEAEKNEHCKEYNLLACRECLHILPAANFADKHRKGKREAGRGHAYKRFCLDCGVHPTNGITRWVPGTHIQVKGLDHVVCKECRELQPSYKIHLPHTTYAPISYLCRSCGEREQAEFHAQFEELRRKQAEEKVKEEEMENDEAWRREGYIQFCLQKLMSTAQYWMMIDMMDPREDSGSEPEFNSEEELDMESDIESFVSSDSELAFESNVESQSDEKMESSSESELSSLPDSD